MSNSANLRSSTLRALARLNRVEAADESPGPDNSDAEDPEQSDSSEDLGGDLPDMVPDEEDPADGEDVDDGDESFTIDDVIKCFLRANPNPTDEQVHAFADLMDMSYEEFEAEIFKKFGEVIRQATSIGPSESEDDVQVEGDSDVDLSEAELDEEGLEDDSDQEIEADDSLDVQDDIDMFVIAYMLFNPEPSDDQIHKLAFVVDLTREQMEERIYRMLANYMQVDDGSSDEEEPDTDTQDTEDTEDTDPDEEDQDEDDTETTDNQPETATDDQGEQA